MAITSKTRKILWARSGNQCAICKEKLVLEKDPYNRTSILGEECHIISKKTNGPRHENIQNFNYDSDENLLLLCCNHHTMVDEQIENFPAEKLKQIKLEHEKSTDSDFNAIETKTTPSKEESLLSFIVGKHDKEMNIESSKQTLHSPKGLEIAFYEVGEIKEFITEFVRKTSDQAPQFVITTRKNDHNLIDVIFKLHTLLVQFYQAYNNSASDSYLLFGIVDGLFDERGHAVPFYEPKNREIIRLDFSYNESGDFGWRNREGKKEFYKSMEISELWLGKFFKKVL